MGGATRFAALNCPQVSVDQQPNDDFLWGTLGMGGGPKKSEGRKGRDKEKQWRTGGEGAEEGRKADIR